MTEQCKQSSATKACKRTRSSLRKKIEPPNQTYNKHILGQAHKITKMRYPRNYMGTHLFYKCTVTKKGSSFAYKAIIKQKSEQAGFLVNPSFRTWKNSHQHQIPMDKWIRNIELIKTINFSPRAKWRTYQQFLRTVWTPMKSYWSYHDEEDANCPSCGEFGADTTHILVECTVAQTTWKHISSILSEYHDSWIQISKEQILFHHPLTRKMNIGVIIAAKTALWKILWNVSSQPIHQKVIKCHLKTQLHLLIDTNLRIFNKDANWWKLKYLVNSTLKWTTNWISSTRPSKCPDFPIFESSDLDMINNWSSKRNTFGPNCDLLR